VKRRCLTQCEWTRPDLILVDDQRADGYVVLRSCITRAIENECIVAMTNIAGPAVPKGTAVEDLTEADAIGVGRTCVCAPFAGCVERITDGEEGLLLSSVDLRMIQDARDIYRCRFDLRQAWCAEAKNA
jgi:predicted amidohydrolase